MLLVAAVYAAGAWVLERLTGLLALPAWVAPFLVFLLVLGFPVAMVLAWAFELERGGVVRAGPGPRLGPRDKLGYLLLLGIGTALLVWLLTSHSPDLRAPFVPHPHSVEGWSAD